MHNERAARAFVLDVLVPSVLFRSRLVIDKLGRRHAFGTQMDWQRRHTGGA